MGDYVIDMAEPKDKLLNLGDHLKGPAASQTVYEFGRFLASRITNGTLVPSGVVLLFLLAFSDMKKGVNSSGQPVRDVFLGLTQKLRAVMELSIMKILIRTIFKEEDAAKINEVLQEVMPSKPHEEGKTDEGDPPSD